MKNRNLFLVLAASAALTRPALAQSYSGGSSSEDAAYSMLSTQVQVLHDAMNSAINGLKQRFPACGSDEYGTTQTTQSNGCVTITQCQKGTWVTILKNFCGSGATGKNCDAQDIKLTPPASPDSNSVCTYYWKNRHWGNNYKVSIPASRDGYLAFATVEASYAGGAWKPTSTYASASQIGYGCYVAQSMQYQCQNGKWVGQITPVLFTYSPQPVGGGNGDGGDGGAGDGGE